MLLTQQTATSCLFLKHRAVPVSFFDLGSVVERAVLIPSFLGAVPYAHRERQWEPFEELYVLSSISHQSTRIKQSPLQLWPVYLSL